MRWLDDFLTVGGCGGRPAKRTLGAPADHGLANGRQVAERLRRVAKEHKLSIEAEEAVRLLVEDAQMVEVHHEHEGAKPLFHMAVVRQRHGEKQPEVHIGWADIYLDLILVGVAFNGGLLLKHAFYLCTPVASEDLLHGHDVGQHTIDEHDAGGHERMLSGHHHPPCYGLLAGRCDGA